MMCKRHWDDWDVAFKYRLDAEDLLKRLKGGDDLLSPAEDLGLKCLGLKHFDPGIGHCGMERWDWTLQNGFIPFHQQCLHRSPKSSLIPWRFVNPGGVEFTCWLKDHLQEQISIMALLPLHGDMCLGLEQAGEDDI